ncbi:MAG: aconitase X [Candidatus Aenigmatarchaeota archaeon]
MYLTREEEQVLKGSEGPVAAKCMRLLAKLGDIYGADRMIDVSSCQAAGVSYKSIGEPGLNFLKGFAREGAIVKVPTFLNPAGMDLECWEEIPVSREFAVKQKEIIEAFSRMGTVPTCSCTPYLFGNLPRFGEHLAWSESSAVSFANSVIGARTNREGGFSALASAITGKAPDYGLHRSENRVPQIRVDVSAALKDSADFGAMGYFAGLVVKNRIPFFTGITTAGTDGLKSLGAAMAASGAVALYHMESITPEACLYDPSAIAETIEFNKANLEESYRALSNCNEPDLIVIGCPHASISEIQLLAQKLRGKILKKEFWVCTSKAMKAWSDRMGYTNDLEAAGARILCDTCMVVSPLEETKFGCIGTNSGKAAKYIPGFCKKKVYFGNTDMLIEKAL